MSDVRHEPLFPASLEVVSTKVPGSSAPIVGLVVAQRIAMLTSRAEVRSFIAQVEAAADAAWPMNSDELLELDAQGRLHVCLGCGRDPRIIPPPHTAQQTVPAPSATFSPIDAGFAEAAGLPEGPTEEDVDRLKASG
jgi:hypothetical protein